MSVCESVLLERIAVVNFPGKSIANIKSANFWQGKFSTFGSTICYICFISDTWPTPSILTIISGSSHCGRRWQQVVHTNTKSVKNSHQALESFLYPPNVKLLGSMVYLKKNVQHVKLVDGDER